MLELVPITLKEANAFVERYHRHHKPVVGHLAAFKPFADHEISEEYRKYSGHEVKKFRAVPEITHRRWKELGLMKPLEPDQTAQYKFSDLQMSLYYTIYI